MVVSLTAVYGVSITHPLCIPSSKSGLLCLPHQWLRLWEMNQESSLKVLISCFCVCNQDSGTTLWQHNLVCITLEMNKISVLKWVYFQLFFFVEVLCDDHCCEVSWHHIIGLHTILSQVILHHHSLSSLSQQLLVFGVLLSHSQQLTVTPLSFRSTLAVDWLMGSEFWNGVVWCANTGFCLLYSLCRFLIRSIENMYT